MGFFSPDMEDMIEVFQSETTELIQEMDACLMDAQRDERLDVPAINAIFRVVHSVKSSAAMMGLEAMSTYAHHLEDLFMLFRDDPKILEGNESRLFDCLYQCSDYIKSELSAMEGEDYSPRSIASLMAEINGELAYFKGDFGKKGKEEPKAQDESQSPPCETVTQGGRERIINLRFKEDCAMVEVRAFILVKKLRPLCESLWTIPANLEKGDARAAITEKGLTLHLVCRDHAPVDAILAQSPHLAAIKEELTTPEAKAERAVAEGSAEALSLGGKFSSVPWEIIVDLQEVAGELISANGILDNMIKKGVTQAEMENQAMVIKRLLTDMEGLVSMASLTPISSILPQLYRIVRDISKKEGKLVRFEVEGESIEVDKTLMDDIANPLIHLIRNGVDHGIGTPAQRRAAGKEETGHLSLAIEDLGGFLAFKLTDDGRGLDTRAIYEKAKEKDLLQKSYEEYTPEDLFQLIFKPGFSTTAVTNEFSGRGVGMDVVLQKVEHLGGIVEVDSALGEGTTFTLTMPVSMTSVDSLHFKVGDYDCLLPIRSVEAIHAMDEMWDRIDIIEGRPYLQEKTIMPVIRLWDVFDLDEMDEEYIIVVKGINRSLGLVVGAIDGQITVVEKALPDLLGSAYRGITGITGCAIVGEGTLGMMLNVDKLFGIYQRGLKEDE